MDTKEILRAAELAAALNKGRSDGRIYRDFCAILAGGLRAENPILAELFRKLMQFDKSLFDSEELTPDERRALENYEAGR